jgi:cytoskeletal protein CcmA (bactofilin family)
VSNFFQGKGERDMRDIKANGGVVMARNDAGAVRQTSPEAISTLGQGMLVTGNVVCAGAVQIYGRVIGDIHAAQLTICEGARVEGKVVAQETIIQGTFNGTINSNSVKLQSTALVEGEIFNKSLTIELNAQFEGVARRLDKPVEPPTAAQASGETIAPAMAPAVAPIAETVN